VYRRSVRIPAFHRTFAGTQLLRCRPPVMDNQNITTEYWDFIDEAEEWQSPSENKKFPFILCDTVGIAIHRSLFRKGTISSHNRPSTLVIFLEVDFFTICHLFRDFMEILWKK